MSSERLIDHLRSIKVSGPPTLMPKRIVDLESGTSYATIRDAAKARGETQTEVRRLLSIGWLLFVRNSLEIVAEAEADFRASGLPWRTWLHWHRRGLRFVALAPAELAETVAEINRRSKRRPAKLGLAA